LKQNSTSLAYSVLVAELALGRRFKLPDVTCTIVETPSKNL